MVQWYVEIRLFAMCASPMIQLVCLPKVLYKTLFFNLFLGVTVLLSQEKMETMQNCAKFFGGQTWCIM